MKMNPLGDELLHTEEHTDVLTDMTNLIVIFRKNVECV